MRRPHPSPWEDGARPVFDDDVTADLVYVRLHGGAEWYASGYSAAADDGRDVVVYLDNDVTVHAPYDAVAPAGRLGVAAADDR